jgi:hypothetical protein
MPLVSQTFDQLLDFTRTTSGTFVGSNGLVQTTPASRNLLTFTQQFDNAAWTKTAATVTANTTVAPDGTSTADTITEDTTAASTHRVTRTLAATAVAHTASVYFKAGTRSWGYIRLTDSGGGTRHAYFDLSTGTLGTVETNLTASITSVGNGWYRCTATVNVANTTSTVVFGIADANGGATYNGNGTGSIFIWGAQYEAAAAATTYTRNNGGVYPPRFDYDPVTLAPKGILIEEQRTNLVRYSEQIDNAAWVKTTATVTANTTVAPDGTSTADTITAVLSGGRAVQDNAATATGSHTASVYVRSGVASAFTFLLRNSTTATNIASTTFNLATGVITSTASGTATIAAVGGGWYRVSVTSSGGVTAADVLSTYLYAGISTNATGDSLIFWGAQLEVGAFPTSYIPTVASQVTRTADQTSIVAPNFAPWYNQSEGTFVSEFSFFAGNDAVNSKAFFAVSDGTNNNRVYGNLASTNIPFIFIAVGGATQANLNTGTAVTNNTVAKVATAYKTNDFAAVLNAGTVATDTSGTVPTVDRLNIGNLNNFSQLNGHMRTLRYYPVRLSDAQLQALTA